ncbi:hypothetical protein K2X33_09780 [bacterium]|nr:hypothetical protein [bacterium]
MSRFLTLALALSLAAPVGAQQAAPAPQGTIQNPFMGILTGGSSTGAYNFYQYDQSKLEAMFLQQVFKQRDQDYEYFQKTVKEIEGEFTTLLKVNVYDPTTGLKGISDRNVLATPPGFIKSQDFLKAINDYNVQKQLLQTRILTLTAISEGMVPSSMELKLDQAGQKVGTVPQYAKVSFVELKKFYEDRVAAIDLFVSNLPQNVMTGNNIPYFITANSGKGLVLEAPATRLTSAQLQELREKVLEMQMWDVNATDTLDAYTKFIRQRIQIFLKDYGNNERFRSIDPQIKAMREAEAKMIADAFWTRSYLRTVYGMPIGAIGIEYQERWFHLDVLTSTTNSLTAMLEPVIWEENQMDKIEKAYRRALNRADVRSEKIFDGDLSFLQAGENLLTFLGGQRNLAQASQMMLNLLAADCYEERLIMRGGTLPEMVARFRSRYGSTPENIAYYTKLQIALDPDSIDVDSVKQKFKDRPEIYGKIFGDEADAAFGPGALQGLGGGSTLKAQVANVLTHMQTKQDDLDLAEQIKVQIANAVNPNNQFRAQTKKRGGGLFN